MVAYAAEVASGTSVLSSALTSAMSSGFHDIAATVTSVIETGFPVAIGIVAISVGAHYAIKWVRGIVSKA